MGDPSIPSRDRFGGSLQGSNYNLGPLPPLNSFSGTVDEQIQKAKEWRQKHKPQQQDQQTPSRSASYATATATLTSANASLANASQRASGYNSSSQHTPSRSAHRHRYQNRYENQGQHQSYQSPSHHAPYNLPQSSPASNAPYHQPPVSALPYHPHHQNNPYHNGPPGAVGFTPAPATLWQPNPDHSGTPSYDQIYPYAHQSSATGHYQYNNQSIDPTYHQPQATPYNSYHLERPYRAPHNQHGAQPPYPPQPTAPEYPQQYGYVYPAQPTAPNYPQQHGYAAAQPSHPQYPQQHGYAAQPNSYGYQPQAAQLSQGHYHQRHEALPQRPNQSQDASVTNFSLPPVQQQTVYGQTRAESNLRPKPQPTTPASPRTANSSEDEDWKAFEAEVVCKAPTAASAAVVARNFNEPFPSNFGASRLTTPKSSSHLLESVSTEIPAGDAPQPTALELPHVEPSEPCSVEVSAGDAVRSTTPDLPLGSPVATSPAKITSDDAVRPAVPEPAPDLPLDPGVEVPAGDAVQPTPPGPADPEGSALIETPAGALDQPALDQPTESELCPRAKNWGKALRKNVAIKTSIEGFPLGPLQYTPVDEEDDEMIQDKGKRKASEEPDSPAAAKRAKHAESAAPEPKPKMPVIPFPEKPAVIEERNGEIEFHVVNNDGSHNSFIILTHLKCIFQKQLPKMPKDYIARLVYDRTHLSIAIVKHPLEVVGGITFRPFKDRKFAEIVFCAISSDQQVKGYGAHLMAHLKDYVQSSSPVMHFLTYADNYAIGYFKKQGFTKEITLEKSVWMGYIKDYEGGTIMQCTMLPRVRYLENGRMLLKQRETVDAKIRATSNSHIVHQPPKQWKNGVVPIDPMSIPAIRNAGWSPEMDELARQPRRGANYNQLLHLLNSMQNHQSAWPFLVPVNRDEVQDYYEVIKEPMDLSTMEQKLEADKYPNPEDFLKDAMLIFKNCRQYNSEGTPYTKMANKLEKYVWTKVREIPEWSHLEEELATKK